MGTVAVWEWTRYFTPHFMLDVLTYPLSPAENKRQHISRTNDNLFHWRTYTPPDICFQKCFVRLTQFCNVKWRTWRCIFPCCWKHGIINWNVIHDIITRDANSVPWAEIWEFSKSQPGIIDAVFITKIIVLNIICYVDYYSAAKFKLSILQPSNMTTECSVR